ncbi:uncharacterized protein PG998_010770 [Apiospora kogelbergensis]|uniref:uncharacterized protein n=1 Tax=Apiospora kogelbergensis TaxID=1337665 RepID=UPI00312CDC50
MHYSNLLWLLVAEFAIALNPKFPQIHVRANTTNLNSVHSKRLYTNVHRRVVIEEAVAVDEGAVAPEAEEGAAAGQEPVADEKPAVGEEAAADEGAVADGEAAADEAAAALCAEGQAVKYTVQPADTLGKIAKSLGSGICDIASANQLANIDVIFPNQTLTVPVALAAADDTSCIAPPSNATCVAGGEDTAVVQAGDAFVTIAAGLGISSAALQAANPGVDRFNLQAGQVINVPVCTGAADEIPAAAAEEVAAAVAEASAAGRCWRTRLRLLRRGARFCVGGCEEVAVLFSS